MPVLLLLLMSPLSSALLSLQVPSINPHTVQVILDIIWSSSHMEPVVVDYEPMGRLVQAAETNIIRTIQAQHTVMVSTASWLKQNYNEYERWNLQKQSRRQDFYILFFTNNENKLVEALQTIRTFDPQSPILIYCSSYSFASVTQYILASRIYQTHVMIDSPKDPGIRRLYGFCAYCNDGRNTFIRENIWIAGKGFKEPMKFVPSFKGSFYGAQVIFSNIPVLPHRYSRNSSNGTEIWYGTEYLSFITLMDAMQAHPKFTVPADKQWGAIKNGSWTGMVGQVVRKEADLCGMPVLLNWLRNKYTTPTVLLEFLETLFASAKPQFAPQWQSVVRPFSWNVWLSLVLLVIVAGLVCFIILKYHPEEPRNLTWTRCVFDMIRILCSEVIDDQNPSTPRVIHVGIYMLLTSVIIYSYTGTLLSHITTPVYLEKPIDSVEDIKTRHDMNWLVPPGQGIGNTFNSDPVMLKKRMRVGTMESFRMIEREPSKYVYFNGVHNIKGTIYSDFLDPYGQHMFHISKESSVIAIVWLVQKECAFIEDLNNKILSFQAGGLWDKLYEQAYDLLRKEGKDQAIAQGRKAINPKEEIKFTMKHLLGGLVIYGTGTLLALVAFAFEHALNVLWKKSK